MSLKKIIIILLLFLTLKSTIMKSMSIMVLHMFSINQTWIKTLFLGGNKLFSMQNLVVNALAFLPFSIFIKLINPKIKNAACMLNTLIVIVSVEFVQYFVGRSCDIDDVILNMLGAGLGLIIYNAVIKFISNRKLKNT